MSELKKTESSVKISANELHEEHEKEQQKINSLLEIELTEQELLTVDFISPFLRNEPQNFSKKSFFNSCKVKMKYCLRN